jgi:hypothetical protein
MTRNKKLGWSLMMFLAVGIAVSSSRYLLRNPEMYFVAQRLTYIAHTGSLMLHIATSIVALVVGPLQFLPAWRRRAKLAWHRWLGRLYLGGVILGSLSGLDMVQRAHGGIPSHVGFSSLAILWLITAVMAYRRIRAKDIRSHQQWMIRNYALTFAAVTLRLWLGILFGVLHLEFTEVYITVSWLAWVPNLLVAEWIIHRLNQPRRAQTASLAEAATA